MSQTHQKIILLPPRLDESSKSFFENLDANGALLDFSPVRAFHFCAAEFLLSSLALAHTPPQLYVPQPKLAALLRLLQFHHLTPFKL